MSSSNPNSSASLRAITVKSGSVRASHAAWILATNASFDTTCRPSIAGQRSPGVGLVLDMHSGHAGPLERRDRVSDMRRRPKACVDVADDPDRTESAITRAWLSMSLMPNEASVRKAEPGLAGDSVAADMDGSETRAFGELCRQRIEASGRHKLKNPFGKLLPEAGRRSHQISTSTRSLSTLAGHTLRHMRGSARARPSRGSNSQPCQGHLTTG